MMNDGATISEDAYYASSRASVKMLVSEAYYVINISALGFFAVGHFAVRKNEEPNLT